MGQRRKEITTNDHGIMNRQELISIYTGLSCETQSIRQFEQAYEWLSLQLSNDHEALESIPLTANFWQWWNTQYEALDLAFLESIELDNERKKVMVSIPGNSYKTTLTNEAELRAVWEDFHHVANMGGANYLLKKGVLNSIYTSIKQLIK